MIQLVQKKIIDRIFLIITINLWKYCICVHIYLKITNPVICIFMKVTLWCYNEYIYIVNLIFHTSLEVLGWNYIRFLHWFNEISDFNTHSMSDFNIDSMSEFSIDSMSDFNLGPTLTIWHYINDVEFWLFNNSTCFQQRFNFETTLGAWLKPWTFRFLSPALYHWARVVNPNLRNQYPFWIISNLDKLINAGFKVEQKVYYNQWTWILKFIKFNDNDSLFTISCQYQWKILSCLVVAVFNRTPIWGQCLLILRDPGAYLVSTWRVLASDR